MNCKTNVSIWDILNELIILLQNGCLPLFFASREGHKDVVSFLIENRADVNWKDNVSVSYFVDSAFTSVKQFGQTSLFRACSNGSPQIVSLLIKNKALLSLKTNVSLNILLFSNSSSTEKNY